MYSMLREIDKYIKENGIPFNGVVFSYKYFDPYLDQAITNKIRNICGDHFNTGCLKYTLKYDEDGNLCLIATSDNGKSTLIIYDRKSTDRVSFPGKYYACSEKEIVEEAAMLKYLEKDRLLIRNRIYEMYPDISLTDRVKLEYKLMNDLVYSMFKDFRSKGEHILSKVHYRDLYVIDTHNIIDYLEYLNDRYQIELKEEKEKEEEHKRMDGVCYSEPLCDMVPRKNTDSVTYSVGSREKVNPIISFDDRYHTLEKYPYVYREYAYTTDRKEITYMNYLYNIGVNKYLLVMEPYNGTKYTKMAIFESEKEITRERFVELIKYYLQLSYADGLEEKTLIRSNHTTIDTYNKIIDYAIVGANNGLSNEYFMGKVRRLKEK